MSKIISLLFLLCLVSFQTIAQSPKEEIEAKLEKLQEVMLEPNEEVLSSIVHESLVYVHSSGTVRDKAGFIKEFIDGQTEIYSSEFLDQEITFSGKKIAIVRHNWQADAMPEINNGKIDILVLMVWKKIKGDWKMIARQAASIAR